MTLMIDTSPPYNTLEKECSPPNSPLRTMLGREVRPGTPEKEKKKLFLCWTDRLERFLQVRSSRKSLRITDKNKKPVVLSSDGLYILGQLLERNPKFTCCAGAFEDPLVRNILNILEVPEEDILSVSPTKKLSEELLAFLRSAYKSTLKRHIIAHNSTLQISGELSIFAASLITEVAKEKNSPLKKITIKEPIFGDAKAGFLLPADVPLTFSEKSSKVLAALRE